MFQQALDKVSKQLLVRERYDNFIGGKWVAPTEGKYFDNPSPVTGKRLCQVPRSSAADIELALDAAHKAKDTWAKTSVAERSRILNKIADKLEANLDLIALVETLDNGKPIRETTYADMPLVVDHWRYFASVVAPRKAASPRSITTPWPIITTSLLASSVRLFRGISRFSWRRGNSRRPWPRAIAWC